MRLHIQRIEQDHNHYQWLFSRQSKSLKLNKDSEVEAALWPELQHNVPRNSFFLTFFSPWGRVFLIRQLSLSLTGLATRRHDDISAKKDNYLSFPGRCFFQQVLQIRRRFSTLFP